jgi:hypothetical protein
VWEQTGSVVKSEAGAFVIDTCPPNADCMASFTTVTVQASGLSLTLPMGAFVKVKLELAPAWGSCTTRVSIRNVPSWGGVQNPAGTSQMFYLLGVDGVPGDPGTVVGMGQSKVLSTPLQPMLVHDLRSYESGACDDYWNWAWWATPADVK